MKTTIQINIGKQAFVIDHDAFQQLEQYLNNIKSRISDQSEANEVMEDIEVRIAEIFKTRLGVTRAVVDQSDVAFVISQLGKPEDIFMEDEHGKPSGKVAQGSGNRIERKLFRNPDDKVLTGLLSGMSQYLGIDNPIWLRILFVISIFMTTGTLVIVYLILSAVTPEAKTSIEKLQMRGEDVNLNNIARVAQTETGKTTQQASRGITRFFELIMEFLRGVFRMLPYLFAGLMLMFALSGLLTAVVLFIMTIALNSSVLPSLLFPVKNYSTLAAISGMLVLALPMIALIYISLRILIGTSIRIKGLSWILLFLWILSIAEVSYISYKTAVQFSAVDKRNHVTQLKEINSDTLNLQALSGQVPGESLNYQFGLTYANGLSVKDGKVSIREVKLDIEKSDDAEWELLTQTSSHGRDQQQAQLNATSVEHGFQLDSNVLTVQDYFSFPQPQHWRNQEVKVTLKMPEGKVIYLDESAKDLIHDIDNVTDTYDDDMIGHYWLMTNAGLKCLDKEFSKSKKSVSGNIDELDDLDEIESIKMDASKDSGKLKIELEDKNGKKKSISIEDGEGEKAVIKVDEK